MKEYKGSQPAPVDIQRQVVRLVSCWPLTSLYSGMILVACFGMRIVGAQ